MKHFILLLFICSNGLIFAQANSDDTNLKTDFTYNNTKENGKILDTLYSYNVNLYETSTPFGIKYTVNGKEITKKQYDKYRQFWRSIDACTPCILRTFDADNKILYESFQYQDCLCGEYTEYYKDGSTKTEGQFMKNPDDNWQNKEAKQFCNRKTGTWKHYNPNGSIDKIEEYINGVLVNAKGNSDLIPAVDVKNRESQTQDSSIEKKKTLFNRKK